MKLLFLMVGSGGLLYGMQSDTLLKDAFSKLEISNQAKVCKAIEQKESFFVRNQQEEKESKLRQKSMPEWRKQRTNNAVWMADVDRDRIVLWVGDTRKEILRSTYEELFSTLCVASGS